MIRSSGSHPGVTVADTIAGDTIRTGRRVLRLEAQAVAALESHLGDSYSDAVELIVACGGRAIVSGVVKSGIVARKIAATLTSTATPATFVHPVEALHGDLGLTGSGDVALLVSKSGESEELYGSWNFSPGTG